MVNSKDLRIGQWVYHNGFPSTVYSIIGPAPHPGTRFDNQPVVEVFNEHGLTAALESELELPRPDEFIPKKYSGWINIYWDIYPRTGAAIYETKEEAERHKGDNCVDTIEIVYKNAKLDSMFKEGE